MSLRGSQSTSTEEQTPELTPVRLRAMSVAAGASVANLYYCQPLLADMARTFSVTAEQIGWVAMLTQVGFGLGLLLIIPLGDATERRRLVLIMIGAAALCLIGVAVAPNFGILCLASFALGLASVIPELLVPFAAYLSRPEERGRAVGTVLSGLIVGILLARVLSGYVGAHLGWREMYWIAAALMVLLAAGLRLVLPGTSPAAPMSYRSLMASLWPLLQKHAVLRESAFVGALLFGSFSAFWTTLIFLMETPTYHAGSQEAGLFGLVGVVGAAAASWAGRLSDVRDARANLRIGVFTAFAAYLLFWRFGHQLWGLVVGVILLDAGVQGGRVSNVSRIYRLRPEAQNRINTVYMVAYYAGGALGTTLAAHAWEHYGWLGVCAVGLGLLAVAIVRLALPLAM